MNRIRILLSITLLFIFHHLNAQGLPPGWENTVTPLTHIISIPLSCDPNINGYDLEPGDYIGVFFVNNQGSMTCAGAQEWWGDQNVGIIAFGDDTWSTVKDGFAPNELINWKVYSWRVNKEYPAAATYNTNLPNSNGLFVSNGLSGLTSLNAYGLFVWATATPDTACVGMAVSLNAIPSGSSGYTYTWTSNPPGFNSTIPNPVVYPNIGTKYIITINAAGDYVRDTLKPLIYPGPTGSAGANSVICQNQYYQANANASNFSSVHWQSSGDGNFDNADILNPKYYPGAVDISTGLVTLTLNIFPLEPCEGVVDASLELSIQKLPVAFAGIDQNVCENSSIQLAGTVSFANSFNWSTSGDGAFSNPQSLNPTYSPGVQDIINGYVQLLFVANAITPCQNSDTDEMLVTFSPMPEIDAGSDVTICENDQAELSAVANNFSSVLWFSRGDGTFLNPATLNASYIPGSNDLLIGNVYLIVSAESVSPCQGIVSDSLLVTIQRNSTVMAGNDTTIATGQPVELHGIASNFSSVLWSSSGDGNFLDPLQLNTSYIHGPGDKTEGGVRLFLSALPLSPCTNTQIDSLFVIIDSTVSISVEKMPGFKLYPNPANAYIFVEIPASSEIYNLKIVDIFGILKQNINIFPGRIIEQVILEELPNGIYLLQIQSGKTVVFSSKITIIR